MDTVELLNLRVAQAPDAVAHESLTESLTYQAWLDRSRQRADELQTQGIRRGQRVTMRFTNEDMVRYAIDYVAVHLLGAVPVPINAAAIAGWLEEVESSAAVSWRMSPSGLVRVSETGTATKDEVADILYTSGTTGVPRGYECLMDEVYHIWEPLDGDDWTDRPIELHFAALGSNYYQEMMRGPLLWGSHVVTLGFVQGKALMQNLIDRHINTLRLTPPAASAVIRACSGITIVGVDDISISSAYCPESVLRSLAAVAPNARIVNQYSATESGRAKLKHVFGESPAGSLGRPVEGTQVRIMSEGGHELATGSVGGIQLRHESAPVRRAMDGQAPTDDGFVETGDLGYVDADGWVYLVGRSREIINVGGAKVAPIQVEQMMREIPGVEDVCVVSVPHPTLGEAVAAAVVSERSLQELWNDVVATLVPPFTPVHLVYVGAIPTTLNDKPDKQRVRSIVLDAAEPSLSDAPEPMDESPIINLVAEILELDHPNVDLTWYEAGGDSLMALEAMVAIEDDFDVMVPSEYFTGLRRIKDLIEFFNREAK